MLIIKDSENRNKAVAYIRVSSQRQVDEGVSLEAQKRRILDYCKYKNIPLSEDDIIIEKGVSGGIPLWDRPKGRATIMRNSCHSHRGRCVSSSSLSIMGCGSTFQFISRL